MTSFGADFDAEFDRAAALKAEGRLEAAAEAWRRAVNLKPGHAAARYNLGNTLAALGRADEAAEAYRAAVAIHPGFAEAHCNLGAVLMGQGRAAEAARAYEDAVRARPAYAEAWCNLGGALFGLGRLGEAAEASRRAVALNPDFAAAHCNLAAALADLGRLDEAAAAGRRAVALAPDLAKAHAVLASVLAETGQADQAVAAYARAVALDPADAQTHCNLGNALRRLGRADQALAAWRRAVELRPDLAQALGHLVHGLQHRCDWAEAERWQRLLAARGWLGVPPFTLLALPTTPAEQLASARAHARLFTMARLPAAPRPAGAMARLPAAPRPAGEGRIRLGYLSADFHEHATAYLIAEMIERHDRARFTVAGYSLGPDDASPMRRRLAAAFDRFRDLRALSHGDAARRIAADGIDVLVDLKGYTQDARPRILACRPAPIQVNFLGYPGTMGAEWIDYILADRVVIPPGDEAFYSEKVVRLPGSYQPNDRRRAIAPACPTRAECGLPDGAFVFCCFNNSYKITPQVFDIWMRLLAEVAGSRLWLLAAGPQAAANLRRAAAARGIDPARLVFAPRQPLDRHLARHRLADLFLDTQPFNAHTTASDALWAGLPLVTCRGNTFAGRVAASLLAAVGLPELVAGSLAEYEALALDLARDPGRLAALRQRLAAARGASPLFDTDRATRAVEAAYARMWRLHAAGRPPQGFDLGESGDQRSFHSGPTPPTAV